jgi:hypothetical protein
MNKTLMLVICDFLLLSMLAMARFDPPEAPPEPSLDVGSSAATAEAELIELLEESLKAEQGSRENLSSDLDYTQRELQEKARLLAEREAALETAQTNLQQSTAEAQSLAEEKTRIEREKAKLETERQKLAQRFEQTREQLEATTEERIQLKDTLSETRQERSVSEERLKQTEEALRQRELELAEREAALKTAEAEKAQLAEARAELNRRLEVTEAERRLLAQNLTTEQAEKQEALARADRLTDNVAVLGQGFSQIGQNVTTLAESSEAIQQQIKDARPQTMSEIFTRFQKNRARIRFTSTERGLFGSTSERSYESRSILVDGEDGTTYLLTHVRNSPFTPAKSSRLDRAGLEVSLPGGTMRIRQIGFLAADPRILFIPLPNSLVKSTKLERFQLARHPERWEEAVLVKSDESNFGRTEFRRLTQSARFLKMDRPALGELFADFAASRGDFAFTKNSRLIGLLTDPSHAVVVDDFVAAAVLDLGDRFEPAKARTTIDNLQQRISQLPGEVR